MTLIQVIMMTEQYGSYVVIEKNDSYAIGKNDDPWIQPYVTWSYTYHKDDVTGAVFHDTYRAAKEDFDRRELLQLD